MLRKTRISRSGIGALPARYEAPHVWFKPSPAPPPPQKYKALVCLTGCGVYDGSEIHESVSTLLALENLNFNYTITAPNRNQYHVIDHGKGEPSPPNETRNIASEAARIARGPVFPMDKVDPKDFDCLVFPGGFGVMKNASTFAYESNKGKVHSDIEELILGFYNEKKPIGAACIAPILLAAVIAPRAAQNKNIPPLTITLGSTQGGAQELAQSFGVQLQECKVTDVARCATHKLVTTPAYMIEDATLGSVFTGVNSMCNQLRLMCEYKGDPNVTIAV